MATFCEFCGDWEAAERLVCEVNAAPTPTIEPKFGKAPGKPWSATKAEIMQMWNNLRPNMPIFATPSRKSVSGGLESRGQDGIRVTGSWQFISSVMSRLKELLNYESPQTRLRLIFRGVEPNRRGVQADRPAFIFYFNVERRGGGAQKAPQVS